MASLESLVSRMTSQAAALLLVLLIVLSVQVQLGDSQSRQCTTQLSNLNVCGPFVVAGAPSLTPNSDCCNALQALQQDCFCSTLRIAAQLPTQCNIPPLNCDGDRSVKLQK